LPSNAVLEQMDYLFIFAPDSKKQKKGTWVFPSPFPGMIKEDQIETIKGLIDSLIEEDMFLVDVRIKPINNIKVFLDADKGLPIERCIRINRALYKLLEEKNLYPDGDFSLEVSSPGVDEPLKLHRQYKKNTGRDVSVTLIDGTVNTGKLSAVNEDEFLITYTEGKGKKAVEKELTIPFSDVKQTKVLIKF
jgi:ribosome maturation factor RimP